MNKNTYIRAVRVGLLLLALLLVLPGGRVQAADEDGGAQLHEHHVNWKTTTPKVCIWATDVTLTTNEVAQGQADATLEATVLAAADPAVNYYPNFHGYHDIGSGLSLTAADLGAVSAVVAEGHEREYYTVRLMMDRAQPNERYIEIELTVEQSDSCALTSLKLQQPPHKTNYLVGEQFDPTGMVVIAHYQNGANTDVTAQSKVSPTGALVLGQTQVQLAYGNLTVAVPITVYSAPVLLSIAVTTPPTLLNYAPGTVFDPAGMIVTGYYDDGSSAVLSFTLPGNLTMTQQNHTVIIQAGGLTTQFAAGVVQPPAPTPVPTAEVAAPPAPTALATPTPTPPPEPSPTASPSAPPTAVPASEPAPPPPAGPQQGGQAAPAAPASPAQSPLQVKPHEVLIGLSAGSMAGFSVLLAPDVYVLLWYQNKKDNSGGVRNGIWADPWCRYDAGCNFDHGHFAKAVYPPPVA